MADLDYVTLDVFTGQPFGGNPLVIFPDARALDAGLMQRIAAEFNYSEAVFLLPPDDHEHAVTVRIFTPTNEIPFAGHPNVGLAYYAGTLGQLFGRAVGDRFRFLEGAGSVEAELLRSGGEVVGSKIRAPKPLTVIGEIDCQTVARCASLDESAIRSDVHPPVILTVGLPFAFAELTSIEELGRARPDAGAFADADRRYRQADDRFSLMLYVRSEEEANRLHARMFAPLNNIPEDPATGSACGSLAAYLALLDRSPDGCFRFTIEQGVEMGRPSMIEVEAAKTAGAIEAVWIGGPSVLMARGSLSI